MLITKSEFARRIGVSPVAVGKAVKSGRLSLVGGKLDEKVALLQWDLNRQRAPSLWSAPKHPQPDPGEALAVADYAVWKAWCDDPAAVPQAVKAWVALVVGSSSARTRLADEITDLLWFMGECRDQMESDLGDCEQPTNTPL